MKFSVGDIVTYKTRPRGAFKVEFEVLAIVKQTGWLKLWGIHPDRPKSDYIYADPALYRVVRKASKLHKVLE